MVALLTLIKTALLIYLNLNNLKIDLVYGFILLIPLILITKAILDSGTEKNDPSYLAFLLLSMIFLSAAKYSSWYFLVLAMISDLRVLFLALLSVLAFNQASFTFLSLAYFFYTFSGTYFFSTCIFYIM